MAINIKFDLINNPEPPTLILANRNGNKLGQLSVNHESIELIDKFNDASEVSFTVNKYSDGKITNLWDKLVDFKLVYCKEWDCWFECKVELDEATESVKTVFCTQLGQAELSQIMLYDIEINTEDDIARDDYKIGILYDPYDSQCILRRLLDKAPHYSIIHVDDTLKNIQRSFSFDGTSIYDAFQEIAEEIGCLFAFHSDSNPDYTGENIITNDSMILYDNLVNEQNKIEDWGLSEFGSAFDISDNNFVQHKFGNIDMDNRIIITWSNDIKNAYLEALLSWDYDPKIGSIDTVFGGSSRFGEDVLPTGIEVAFTPILNIGGSAVFVNKDILYDYIEELVSESIVNGIFSEETILNLDKNGRYINGLFIQNVIAATDESLDYDNNNNWAETVGRLMHFSGKYGSISLAQDDVIKYAQNIGVSFEEFIFAHKNGKPQIINRTISVYDLQQNCNDCGYRGEFTDKCPKCGSTNITYGYGEDTLIFVTADELASEGIQLVTDTDSVKNCFKLEAGDDLMTATIRNRNPNGTDYIWYFSDATKSDMPRELVEKIESYDAIYKYYYNEHKSNLDENLLSKYNALVDKYSIYNENLENISNTINGFASLMQAYYNTIDLGWYLKSGLMPTVTMGKTNAEEQGLLLSTSLPSLIAVSNLDTVSNATADSTVLAMAKAIVSSNYKVTISSSSLIDDDWSGIFVITNYSDDEDTYTTSSISRSLVDWEETYVKQKIDKILSKENTDNVSITGLFEKEYDEFCVELKKYALVPLTSFHDACQACIDILIEQGAGNSGAILYDGLYLPYYNKLKAIESEMSVRENEINIILGAYDVNNKLIKDGLQTNIEKLKVQIQNNLNFEDYLGEDLWLQFCAYRREDKYSNSNYISDGLNNAELFKRALEFYEVAENEIFKSAELQHSISATLNNLLAIPKFKPLVESFEVGNWIRVKIDDHIYKLRLVEYEISYGNFNEISVEFSDVAKTKSGYSDLKDILSNASSMASSYDSIKRQANLGNEARDMVQQWLNEGLDASLIQIQNNTNEDIIIDNNGLIGRSYSDIEEEYSPEQIRLTHNIIAFTDDNWKSVKQAIGKHKYKYFDNGKVTSAIGYGMNADFVVAGVVSGSQIIGGDIYSDNYSIDGGNGSYINLREGDFSFGGGALRFEIDDTTKKGKLIISSDPLSTNVTELNDEWLKTTTVYAENLHISSGNISGTLTANQIDASELHVNAANIDGELTAHKIAASDNASIYALMDSNGFKIYHDSAINDEPKIQLTTSDDGTINYLHLGVGSGSDGSWENDRKFMIEQTANGAKLYYKYENNEYGFLFDKNGVSILDGVFVIGTAVFG